MEQYPGCPREAVESQSLEGFKKGTWECGLVVDLAVLLELGALRGLLQP